MLQAINGAGLSTSSTSAGVLVDSSPPLIGAIMETSQAGENFDIDYQVEHTCVLNTYIMYATICGMYT